MNVQEFVSGERVAINGLYVGHGSVKVVKEGKVYVNCDDGVYRSYTQGDLNAAKLKKVVFAGVPKAPQVGDFRIGDQVDVKGDLYQGTGTVQASKNPSKVRVRVADGKLFSYGQADLNNGKLVKKGSRPDLKEASAPLPQMASVENQHGKLDLPAGSDVTITIGAITLTIKNNGGARA